MIELRKMPMWHVDDLSGDKIIKVIQMIILKYEYATVADLYDTIALHVPTFGLSDKYIENCYGWGDNSMWNFKKMRVDGGYTLTFDEPKLLSEYGVRI